MREHLLQLAVAVPTLIVTVWAGYTGFRETIRATQHEEEDT